MLGRLDDWMKGTAIGTTSSALIIVQPATVIAWQRKGFRLFGSGRFVADGVDGHRFRRPCAS